MSPMGAPRARHLVILSVIAMTFYFFGVPQHRFEPKERDFGELSRLKSRFYTWTTVHDVPQTTIVRHVTGWTIFNNLFVHNGTIYIITDRPTDFPPIREITSTGIDRKPEQWALLEPTNADMQIISPHEAITRFGLFANRLSGVSFMATESAQFVAHYYHFCAEILLGLWRTYSSLDPGIQEDGITTLVLPTRLILPHVKSVLWRDPPQMNPWVLHAAFPAITVETAEDWEDRIQTNQLYLLDSVILTDRSAAHRAKQFSIQSKTVAVAHLHPGSSHWWAPIRNNVIGFASMGPNVARNSSETRPVITYISRQGRGRALDPASHKSLVKELEGLGASYGWEVVIPLMENLSKAEQIQLASRTTVLVGVHGNGLTSLLWMNPTPSATVIEIFRPGGFLPDYQVPAEMIGLQHYGVWDNRYFRTAGLDKPRIRSPKGFSENRITVDGSTVAALVKERILTPNKLSSMDTSAQEEIIDKWTAEH